MLWILVKITIIIALFYVGGFVNFTGRAKAWNIRQMMIGGLFRTGRPATITAIGTIGVLLYRHFLPVKPEVLFCIIVVACVATLMEMMLMVYAMKTTERPELPYNA